MLCMPCILILCFINAIPNAAAWDSDDLEVFDVVEEVGVNFYTLLEIKQDATEKEIKKAFRKQSLIWHPDKNSSPDAEVKFRQLAAVYDILKDNGRRAKYHQVLEHGLPDWRQAIYYYRRVRKMGLAELSIILFIIVTIGQYLVAWAAYFEKKYAIEEFISIRSKKLQKKQKKGKIDGTVEFLPELVSMSVLPKPSVSCTLPVQICKLIWFLLVELPPLTYHWTKKYFEERRRRKELEAMSREESSEEEEVVTVVRERGPRRRKGGFTVPEVAPGEDKSTTINLNHKNQHKDPPKPTVPPVISGGLWTDDDFSDLIRYMKKYPTGTSERWEKIGESMRRPATEVAHMAHKMKDEGFKPITKEEENANDMAEVQPKKVKTRGEKMSEENDEGSWSQIQQKAFEVALAKFPKGAASDRWEKISKCVPGKTKEECMQRYKQLVDLVKKKKEKESPTEIEELSESPS